MWLEQRGDGSMVGDELVGGATLAERVISYGLTGSGFKTPFQILRVLGTSRRLSLWRALSLWTSFVSVDPELCLCGQTLSLWRRFITVGELCFCGRAGREAGLPGYQTDDFPSIPSELFSLSALVSFLCILTSDFLS